MAVPFEHVLPPMGPQILPEKSSTVVVADAGTTGIAAINPAARNAIRMWTLPLFRNRTSKFRANQSTTEISES
jgi:hypothetical protein